MVPQGPKSWRASSSEYDGEEICLKDGMFFWIMKSHLSKKRKRAVIFDGVNGAKHGKLCEPTMKTMHQAKKKQQRASSCRHDDT